MSSPYSIAVLICTYKRPAYLLRCLEGLRAQTLKSDDVILIVHESDRETLDAIDQSGRSGLPVRVITVTEPGTVAARNAGLDVCSSTIVAITDDDTVPHPDWLERIAAIFAHDAKIGGVGGRDRCMVHGVWEEGRKTRVGEIQWFGRAIGYHHLGCGGSRPVELLKGANMSFRMASVGALRFDRRLRGSKAQPNEDNAFCLAVRRSGATLIYDPDVCVDHYEGPRNDPRHYSSVLPVADAEGFKELPFNWVVTIWDEFSAPRHLIFILWNFLVGTRVSPGFVQAIRFTPKMGIASWNRFWLTQQATGEAYAMLIRQKITG